MGFFNNLILALTGIGAIFLLYQSIKHHPDFFSKENLSKSFFSMGVLALILIAVVGLVVVLLRN